VENLSLQEGFNENCNTSIGQIPETNINYNNNNNQNDDGDDDDVNSESESETNSINFPWMISEDLKNQQYSQLFQFQDQIFGSAQAYRYLAVFLDIHIQREYKTIPNTQSPSSPAIDFETFKFGRIACYMAQLVFKYRIIFTNFNINPETLFINNSPIHFNLEDFGFSKNNYDQMCGNVIGNMTEANVFAICPSLPHDNFLTMVVPSLSYLIPPINDPYLNRFKSFPSLNKDNPLFKTFPKVPASKTKKLQRMMYGLSILTILKYSSSLSEKFFEADKKLNGENENGNGNAREDEGDEYDEREEDEFSEKSISDKCFNHLIFLMVAIEDKGHGNELDFLFSRMGHIFEEIRQKIMFWVFGSIEHHKKIEGLKPKGKLDCFSNDDNCIDQFPFVENQKNTNHNTGPRDCKNLRDFYLNSQAVSWCRWIKMFKQICQDSSVSEGNQTMQRTESNQVNSPYFSSSSSSSFSSSPSPISSPINNQIPQNHLSYSHSSSSSSSSYSPTRNYSSSSQTPPDLINLNQKENKRPPRLTRKQYIEQQKKELEIQKEREREKEKEKEKEKGKRFENLLRTLTDPNYTPETSTFEDFKNSAHWIDHEHLEILPYGLDYFFGLFDTQIHEFLSEEEKKNLNNFKIFKFEIIESLQKLLLNLVQCLQNISNNDPNPDTNKSFGPCKKRGRKLKKSISDTGNQMNLDGQNENDEMMSFKHYEPCYFSIPKPQTKKIYSILKNGSKKKRVKRLIIKPLTSKLEYVTKITPFPINSIKYSYNNNKKKVKKPKKELLKEKKK